MLIKQAIDISFAQGLDTKTDPKRVAMGNFVSLENTIFDKGGLLQKRNGYAQLSSLPDTSSTYLTTFNGNLTAVGTAISAYNSGNSNWVSKGSIQPMSINTLPLIRNNLNQMACDTVVAANGLICTVYLESNGTTVINKYAISDSVTGQNIVSPTVIPVAAGAVTGGMRVFLLGTNFIIVFTNIISTVAHLQYVAVSTNNPTLVGSNTDIASSYVPATTLSWDGYVVGSHLYLAYNTATGGQSVKVTYLTNTLSLLTAVTFSGYTATLMSVTADTTGTSGVIYVSFYNLSSTTGFTLVVDQNLNTILNPMEIIASGTILNLTSAAQNGTCLIFGEVSNAYSFDSSIPTNYIVARSVTPLGMTFHSVFSSGVGSITASNTAGLINGMYLVDNTSAAHIAAGTIFTISGSTLTLSINTAGNSASSPGDSLSAAIVSSSMVVIRSVGLASKAFIINGVVYFLSTYSSAYQPTYFLINGSDSISAFPVVSAKLAYENAGGYLINGLPSITINDTTAQIPYLYKDLIEAVNKNTAVSAGTQVNGIYSQTGINLSTFEIGTQGLDTAEIGSDLHLSGGFLWMYDGYLPVEHNFFLWPDTDQINPTNTAAWTESPVSPTGTFLNASTSITLSSTSGVAIGMAISDSTNPSYIPSGTIVMALSGSTATISKPTTHAGTTDTLAISGSMASKPDSSTNTNAYYYQFTYEWTDNAGNAFRSAPSIPIPLTTTGSATTGSVVLNIPTLRLTYKISSPVKIVIYRWSVGQQIYYQTTSITAPLLNDTTVDSVTYTDVNNDATILGNNIIYTNGGVVEDINAPASNIMTLFDTRLWLVDAEDPNLLWFSKQVIENTPVEMSDLFTIYIAPTTAAQGSTGPITALSVLDDKLIIFKQNAIYYINGIGPDNTGANNTYSQPIFVTSTVGCANQQSIVFMPQGLMFQSDKGIWLLDRSLGTNYIGSPVEKYNAGNVESAQNIPQTNQVRFILDIGITLMYDYYYNQWGTFTNVPAISSCIFEGMHTFINSFGAVYQEFIGSYLDGSIPVLMQFTTGPLRLGDLQNYQRAYFFYLLGTYNTPHKLAIGIAYDYSTSSSQSVILVPSNYNPAYGAGPANSPYGQGALYGGNDNLEQFRVFLQRQRCQAFSISLQEIYDATYGAPAGAGLTISGLNLVCAFKQKFKPEISAQSFG